MQNAGDPMRHVARVFHFIKDNYPTFWNRNHGKVRPPLPQAQHLCAQEGAGESQQMALSCLLYCRPEWAWQAHTCCKRGYLLALMRPLQDHFIWIPGDIGACWLLGPPIQQNPIKIVHFGLQVRCLLCQL